MDRSEAAPAFGESNAAYHFGTFRLDLGSGLLVHDEQTISLTPKVFKALLYFLKRSGKLVTKDELMN